jgi:hypothetical protein
MGNEAGVSTQRRKAGNAKPPPYFETSPLEFGICLLEFLLIHFPPHDSRLTPAAGFHAKAQSRKRKAAALF